LIIFQPACYLFQHQVICSILTKEYNVIAAVLCFLGLFNSHC